MISLKGGKKNHLTQIVPLKKNEIHLGTWNELVGKLSSFSSNDEYVLEIGDYILAFSITSKEALYLQERINDDLIGKTIGILRTDILEKPLAVRLIF